MCIPICRGEINQCIDFNIVYITSICNVWLVSFRFTGVVYLLCSSFLVLNNKHLHFLDIWLVYISFKKLFISKSFNNCVIVFVNFILLLICFIFACMLVTDKMKMSMVLWYCVHMLCEKNNNLDLLIDVLMCWL